MESVLETLESFVVRLGTLEPLGVNLDALQSLEHTHLCFSVFMICLAFLSFLFFIFFTHCSCFSLCKSLNYLIKSKQLNHPIPHTSFVLYALDALKFLKSILSLSGSAKNSAISGPECETFVSENPEKQVKVR